jgi:integrase
VELETPTGRIIARVMPSRGRDTAGRWYWRARRSVAGKQADVWTGRAHRPEALEQITAIAAGLAPAASARARGEAAAPRTVGDLLDRWIAERVDDARDLAPRTRASYRGRVQALRATVGHVALEALAVRHLAAHKSARERAGAAAGTIVMEINIVGAAWQWGADRGFVSGEVPRVEVRPRPKQGRTPTAAELARVVALASPLIALALKVQAATGARIGEVTELRHVDIDLDPDTRNGLIRLGKHEGARKTGVRAVPIMGEVVEALRAVHRPGDPGRVWGRGANLRVQAFLRLLDWNKAKCEQFTSHGIRRLAADTMARAGVEVATAANILGHSITMMLNVYRQVTDDDRALAVRRAGLGDLTAGNVVSLDAARHNRTGGPRP